MKLPFKTSKAEELLSKQGNWYLLVERNGTGEIVDLSAIHACNEALEKDKKDIGLIDDSFSRAKCSFCKNATVPRKFYILFRFLHPEVT